MNRRQVLHGVLAMAIAPRVDAMQYRAIRSSNGDVVVPAASATYHLNATAAQHEYIKAGEALRDAVPPFSVVLDLARYKTASPSALRLLGSLPVDFADLGLRSLGLATACALASWRTHFFLFTELPELTADEAWALVSPACGSHALIFEQLDSLDVEAARGLVIAAAGNPLGVTLSRVSDAVVRELARHDHELYVNLRHGLLGDRALGMLDEQQWRYRSQFDLSA